MDIQRVAVVGTGMMGPGIAVTFALGGFETVLVSRTRENAEKGIAAARDLADTLLANGLADKDQVQGEGTTHAIDRSGGRGAVGATPG